MRRWLGRLLCWLGCVRRACAVCQPWCTEPCTALNGNVQIECEACLESEGYRCFDGANGWDDWRERNEQFHAVVGPNGEVTYDGGRESGVVERTASSLVYEAPYYDIANRQRSATGSPPVTPGFEWEELPVPQTSPRHCFVHSCVLVEGDDACAHARQECTEPLGHLRPIGEQWSALDPVAEHDVRESPLDARGFWKQALSKSVPMLLKGGAASVTDLDAWSDEALLRDCTLEDGKSWDILVERNNRIVQNDRHPLMPNWSFCKFLQEYATPEYTNMLYMVNAISKRGLGRLTRRLALPSVLACDELYTSLYDARVWMSMGNTTSSAHFDTHENLLLQMSGNKEILLWHPNATGRMYMDHHTKFGLSPINMDRVDLQRFPEVSAAAPLFANLTAGDALYIPDGWWHVVHSPKGRNVAVALEFAPYRGEHGMWPDDLRVARDAPGLYWAEQMTINAAMRERLAEDLPSRKDGRPIKCDAPLEKPPSSLEDCTWLGVKPIF